MAANQPSHYLKDRVLTASPPRLHLMLIEGALRFGNQAQQHLEKNDEEQANEAMVRAIEILGEMLAGVRHSDSEINQKLSELYQFLFYTLTSAYVNTDAAKLADVLRILEFERETWRLACERAASAETSDGEAAAATPVVAQHLASPSPTNGLSLEA